MKLHRYVDHQRLHIVTKDVISLSISVLLLFRHYISHKITFGAPSSGGVLRSACGAFIIYFISSDFVLLILICFLWQISRKQSVSSMNVLIFKYYKDLMLKLPMTHIMYDNSNIASSYS